jgi:hypothetical protein
MYAVHSFVSYHSPATLQTCTHTNYVVMCMIHNKKEENNNDYKPYQGVKLKSRSLWADPSTLSEKERKKERYTHVF